MKFVEQSSRSVTFVCFFFQEGNDAFCWRCHTDAVQICCSSCVRSYHARCFRTTQTVDWQCPDCVDVAAAVKRMDSSLRWETFSFQDAIIEVVPLDPRFT